MAFTNSTRFGTTCQKKSMSIMSFEYSDSFIKLAKKTFEGDENYKVANIPANSIITGVYAVTDLASAGATKVEVQVGTSDGGAQLMVKTDIKAVGIYGALVSKVRTDSGVSIYVKVKVTGTATSTILFNVVVEYIEYTKNCGEYTMF